MTKSKPPAAEIFSYSDYRAFVRDRFTAAQAQNAKFSIRAFCKKAGIASAGYFQFVLKGERNLSPQNAVKFARALSLTSEESRFFQVLVAYNQCLNTEEKLDLFNQLTQFKRYQKYFPLQREHYEFYSHWIVPVIRELVAMGVGHLKPAVIAQILTPPSPIQEVERAFDVLSKLGMISKEGGRWVSTHSKVGLNTDVQNLLARSFHREMLKLALRALDQIEIKSRDISSLTLTVSSDSYEELKKAVIEFRKSIFEKYGETKSSDDQVCQLNFQLFPVTKKIALT